jgi:hypothetical protein
MSAAESHSSFLDEIRHISKCYEDGFEALRFVNAEQSVKLIQQMDPASLLAFETPDVCIVLGRLAEFAAAYDLAAQCYIAALSRQKAFDSMLFLRLSSIVKQTSDQNLTSLFSASAGASNTDLINILATSLRQSKQLGATRFENDLLDGLLRRPSGLRNGYNFCCDARSVAVYLFKQLPCIPTRLIRTHIALFLAHLGWIRQYGNNFLRDAVDNPVIRYGHVIYPHVSELVEFHDNNENQKMSNAAALNCAVIGTLRSNAVDGRHVYTMLVGRSLASGATVHYYWFAYPSSECVNDQLEV